MSYQTKVHIPLGVCERDSVCSHMLSGHHLFWSFNVCIIPILFLSDIKELICFLYYRLLHLKYLLYFTLSTITHMCRKDKSYWCRKWNHWAKFSFWLILSHSLHANARGKRVSSSSNRYGINSWADWVLLTWRRALN